MKRRNIFGSYNAVLGLVFIVFGIFGVSSVIVMIRSDGFVPIEKIVAEQQKNAILFNSPLSSMYKHKLALHKERAANIVAIGSSRSHQFRAYAFSESFTNLGGVFGPLRYAESFVRELIDVHKPGIIIWAIDYQDFFQAPGGAPLRTEDEKNIFSPLGLVVTGTLDWKSYWKLMFDGEVIENFPVKLMGLSAKATGGGYDYDGSMYHFGRDYDVLGKGDIKHTNSRESLYRGIVENSSQGDRVNTVQPWALAVFKSILDYAASKNVIVIPVLVPSSPAVMEILDEKPDVFRRGLDELRQVLPRYSPHFADFVDPREYGSSECEFLDAHHGGEVTYLRIMLGLSDMPGSPLKSYVRRDLIGRLIEDYENNIFITEGRIGSQFKSAKRTRFSPMCRNK